MHYLQAVASLITTPSTPHVPQSSSGGVCKGRGSNMFSGDGSGDYSGILAAKSQQSQLQPRDNLAASEVDPASSAVQRDDQSVQQQLQQQQQPDRELPHASGGASPSARQPCNEHLQPQSNSLPVEQQPKHKDSSRQQREQQVQATEQLLQSYQHQSIQLGGQQVPDERQQVQPQGQSEEGRLSRQADKATGQKKGRKKKQQGPSQQGDVLQREGAFEDGNIQGGLGRGQGKMRGLECERVIRWGHDKFEETQVFTTC